MFSVVWFSQFLPKLSFRQFDASFVKMELGSESNEDLTDLADEKSKSPVLSPTREYQLLYRCRNSISSFGRSDLILSVKDSLNFPSFTRYKLTCGRSNGSPWPRTNRPHVPNFQLAFWLEFQPSRLFHSKKLKHKSCQDRSSYHIFYLFTWTLVFVTFLFVLPALVSQSCI